MTIEFLAALVLTVIVTTMFGSRLIDLFRNWQRMETDVRLQDVGRYMLTKLERELCLSGVEITVDEGTLYITTEYGNRRVRIEYRKGAKGVYQITTTSEGSGTNPLFIRDCPVEDWHVNRVGTRQIFIHFVLTDGDRRQEFDRIFYLLNGVADES